MQTKLESVTDFADISSVQCSIFLPLVEVMATSELLALWTVVGAVIANIEVESVYDTTQTLEARLLHTEKKITN